MISSYTLWLSDKYGTRIQSLDNFTADGGAALQYSRALNAVTPLQLTIPANSEYTALFKDPAAWLDTRIEVWRRLNDGVEYLDTDTIWFVRNVRRKLTNKSITLTAYNALELLNRRIIAFKSGTEQATKTNRIDNIMKAYVRENIGSLASAARNYSSYLSVEADLSNGVSITKAASFDNLLEALQDLALQSSVQGTTPVPIFFDIFANATASSVSSLEFRTRSQRRGDDRTYGSQLYSLTLSEETLTLDNVEVAYEFNDEANYIYVGGAGEASARSLAEVSDNTRIAYSPINRREAFVSYTNSNVAAVLQSQGYKALREKRPRKIISADIANNDNAAYGRDWFFGDELTAQVDDDVFDVHIASVAVSVSGGKDVVKAALRAELVN